MSNKETVISWSSGVTSGNGMAYKTTSLNSKKGVLQEMEILTFFNGSQKIKSNRTRKAYHGPLLRFQALLSEQGIGINDVEPSHIEQFADRVKQTINYRTHSPGVSDSTVQLNLAAVSSYYKWRMETGRSERNPVKEFRFRRTERPRVVTPITPEVATEMCRMARDSAKVAIVKLFRRSGIRNQELVDMNQDSITFEPCADGSLVGIAVVVGKGEKRRRVYITPDACEAIADYLAERGNDSEPAMFVSRRKTRVSIRTVQRWIREMASAAGDHRGHPHRLRHLFASEATAGGMSERDLMDRLGHEDNSTTQVYINVSDEDLMERCKEVIQGFQWKLAA